MTEDSGFNGNWEGMVTSPDGKQYPLKFTFTSDGTTLSGTTESDTGNAAIANGKVVGNECIFQVEINLYVTLFTGTLSGDTIQLRLDFEGMVMESILQRPAPAPAIPDVDEPSVS